ncbi:unnamed protein product [Mytilus coruscus]|uniref:Uncharacterized protein n=1 Tax=Mytilus coruscus TaxID=42192 RepID=A0A6J8F1M6_MYTCO|nr:unnamed protein product [Mytilus coruscus]
MQQKEQNFCTLKQKQAAERVEDALKNLRVLADKPKITSPSLLLASMEVQVECVLKAGHIDTDFFCKALQACRQYETNPDICSLCLKLLGSNDDKKISAAIAEWVKTKKHKPTIVDRDEQPPPAQNKPSYSFWTESSKDICITGVTLIAQSTMKSYKTFDYKTTQSLIANEERRLKAVERLIVEKQRLTFAMESERLAIERQRFYIEQQEQQLYMAQMNINFAQMGVRVIEQQTLNIPDDI